MDFNTELQKLIELFKAHDDDAFKTQYELMKNNFELSEEQKETINNSILAVTDETVEQIDNFIAETKLKLQLKEITEIVSLSYIAKKYFNHTRGWLYQRINGNIVKGKPAKFTNEELITLQNAIKDIGRKLESFSFSS